MHQQVCIFNVAIATAATVFSYLTLFLIVFRVAYLVNHDSNGVKLHKPNIIGIAFALVAAS